MARRIGFAVFVLVALFATVALTLAASKALGYEPPNPKADAPKPLPTTAELVQAATAGCVQALGIASVGISDGVVLIRCTPDLGVHKP